MVQVGNSGGKPAIVTIKNKTMGLFAWFKKRRLEKEKKLKEIQEAKKKSFQADLFGKRSSVPTYSKHSPYIPPEGTESIIENPIYQRHIGMDIDSEPIRYHLDPENDSGIRDTEDFG